MRRLPVDDLRPFRRRLDKEPVDNVIEHGSFQDPVTNDSDPSPFLNLDEALRVIDRVAPFTDCDRLRRVVPWAGLRCALPTRGRR